MKSLLTLTFILTFSLYFNTAWASSQMTVGDLRDICIGSDEASKNACSFYIWGATEGVSLGTDIERKSPENNTQFTQRHDPPVCLPDGMSKDKMEFLVKKKIGEDLMFHAEDNKMPAVSFIVAIISQEFPCKK